MKLTEQQQELLRWLVRRAWRNGSPHILEREMLLLILAADTRAPSFEANGIDEAMAAFIAAGLVEIVHGSIVSEYKLTGWAEQLVPPEFDASGASALSALDSGHDNAQRDKLWYMVEFIDSSFQKEDFELLCFELGVDVDNLRGDTKELRAKSLVERFSTRGEIDLVDRKLAEKRPRNYERQF